MLITREWSEPRPVKYGKNIIVRSSRGNFSYKIRSAKEEQSVEGTINERVHTIAADDKSIRLIHFPEICFRANTNEELHVNFEQL